MSPISVRSVSAPFRLSLAVAGVCALLVAAAVAGVRTPGWIGLRTAPDAAAHRIAVERVDPNGPLGVALAGRTPAVLTAAGGVALTDIDRIEEPDVLPSYRDIEALLARQDAVAAALDGPVRLDFLDAAGAPFSVTVQPGQRPLSDLPALFWLQLVGGGGALLISGWLWSLRPRDFAVRLFALSGLGIGAGIAAAAVYSSRELALDGALFRFASAVNHLGGFVFGGAMMAVFAVYPRPLFRTRRPLAVMAAAYLAFWAADTAHLAGSSLIGSYLPIITGSFLILALIGVQTWRSRKDPIAGAAMRWLGLSVLLGIGGFVLANALPVAFGAKGAVPQGAMMGPFLLIYLGLALGLGRYRLFDLDRWAYRTIFYLAGALAVLAMDAALLMVLQVERIAALGVALLLVGLIYLPLRDAIWRRLTARRRRSPDQLFGEVMETVLTVRADAREAGWRELMQRLFEPLSIETAAAPVSAPALGEDGLRMTVPNVAPYPALNLRFARGGRALFGPDDLALARQAAALMVQAEAGREAYERGAAEERARIAQDLHDDVGARLAAGLTKTDLAQARAVVREAIADVRLVVGGLTGERRPLGHVLADLRHEAAARLSGSETVLHWPLAEADDEVEIAYPVQKALRAAVRAAVSDALAAGPAGMTVSVERAGGRLRLAVDGADRLVETV